MKQNTEVKGLKTIQVEYLVPVKYVDLNYTEAAAAAPLLFEVDVIVNRGNKPVSISIPRLLDGANTAFYVKNEYRNEILRTVNRKAEEKFYGPEQRLLNHHDMAEMVGGSDQHKPGFISRLKQLIHS